jgi:hypothetical protein
MLASTTMEQTDFTSMPRPGKAIDYVYRMSFFERPMIDLGASILQFTISSSPPCDDALGGDAALSAA